MKSNYKELFSNMVVFAISNIGTKIIQFFLVPLYTNYLSSGDYGTADLVMTTSSLFIPLATLAINESVYRFTMDKSIDDKEVLKCFYYVYFFSVIITIFFSMGFVFLPSMRKYRLLFAFITIFTILNDGYALYVKGRGENRIFAIDNIVYVIALASCNIILLMKFNQGVNGYLLAIVISKVISLFLLLVWGRSPRYVRVREIDFSLLRKMLRYSIPLLFNSINWWVISSSDKYMLNFMIGSSEVGLYTAASKIPALVNTATTVFTEAWTIASIKEHEQGKGMGFYNSVFKLFSASMAILVSAIMLIARPFMKFYVSDSYYTAVIFLPTLLMSAYYLSYASFIGVTFSTVMKSEVIMKSSLYAAVINVIVNLLLIPKLGGLGAAIATMLTYAVISCYRYFKAQNYMPLTISKKKMIMTFLILTIQQIFVTNAANWICVSIVCMAVLILLYLETIKSIYKLIKLTILSKSKRE